MVDNNGEWKHKVKKETVRTGLGNIQKAEEKGTKEIVAEPKRNSGDDFMKSMEKSEIDNLNLFYRIMKRFRKEKVRVLQLIDKEGKVLNNRRYY